MKPLNGLVLSVIILLSGIAVGSLAEYRGNEERERKLKESEVPAAALAALKKAAGGAAILEYTEEIEHGHKFYEATWKGPEGEMEAEVTEAGDLIEIEEAISPSKVPLAVRKLIEKKAEAGGRVDFEKKTLILYEAHFTKKGKRRELVVTPDGRIHHEEGERAHEGHDEDEDDDD